MMLSFVNRGCWRNSGGEFAFLPGSSVLSWQDLAPYVTSSLPGCKCRAQLSSALSSCKVWLPQCLAALESGSSSAQLLSCRATDSIQHPTSSSFPDSPLSSFAASSKACDFPMNSFLWYSRGWISRKFHQCGTSATSPYLLIAFSLTRSRSQFQDEGNLFFSIQRWYLQSLYFFFFLEFSLLPTMLFPVILICYS